MNRITYDPLDHASVVELLKTPPVIEHQTFYPFVPRYIQPICGLEVSILGIKDVLRAAPFIDRYHIRNRYGNVIASSRLALNEVAYCVVFKTWAQTSHFLSDPFTAFDSGFGVGASHSVSQALPARMFLISTAYLRPPARPTLQTHPSANCKLNWTCYSTGSTLKVALSRHLLVSRSKCSSSSRTMHRK
jgi:hypothetical protein